MSILDYAMWGNNGKVTFPDPNKPKKSRATYYVILTRTENNKKQRNRRRNKIAKASRKANRG